MLGDLPWYLVVVVVILASLPFYYEEISRGWYRWWVWLRGFRR